MATAVEIAAMAHRRLSRGNPSIAEVFCFGEVKSAGMMRDSLEGA
jgi:hypothetical protein